MSLRFVALIVSVIALLASAAMLSTRGLNLGIDFAGGAVLEIDKPEDVSADQIRDTVTSLVTGDVQVNSARGTLGAQQNRLDSTLRSLANVRENTSAAESRIRDVDVAMETAELTKNSIMQQAAVSVLQQANVQPQIALSLLQG